MSSTLRLLRSIISRTHTQPNSLSLCYSHSLSLYTHGGGSERQRMAARRAWGWFQCLSLFLMIQLSMVVAEFFKPFNVSYDHRALIIDGKRRMLISAGIHYPRATAEVLRFSNSVVYIQQNSRELSMEVEVFTVWLVFCSVWMLMEVKREKEFYVLKVLFGKLHCLRLQCMSILRPKSHLACMIILI